MRRLKCIKLNDTFIELHKKHAGDQFDIYVYIITKGLEQIRNK